MGYRTPFPELEALGVNARHPPWLFQRARRWLVGLVAGLLAVMLLRVAYTPFIRVEAHSMFPTLRHGDFLLVNQQVYRLHPPRRGDVVVFLRNGTLLVKRVIGLPGEEMAVRGHRAVAGGVLLEEPYAVTRSPAWGGLGMGRAAPDTPPIVIPPGHYYLLGDNRTQSFDSRAYGTVEGKAFLGRVEAVWLPWERIHRVH